MKRPNWKIFFGIAMFILASVACENQLAPNAGTGAAPTATVGGMTQYVPNATATPIGATAQPTSQGQVNGYDGQAAEFNYVPGGSDNFGKIGHDVTPPQGLTTDQCFRVWQASNLQNLAFTALFCNWMVSNPAPAMIWTEATSMNISGSGSTQFDLYRDFSPAAANGYYQANAKRASGGLGWFITGYNGTVCVNNSCLPLSAGAYQIPFPQNWHGHFTIKIDINNGFARFYQGERLTSKDNWPLPQ